MNLENGDKHITLKKKLVLMNENNFGMIQITPKNIEFSNSNKKIGFGNKKTDQPLTEFYQTNFKRNENFKKEVKLMLNKVDKNSIKSVSPQLSIGKSRNGKSNYQEFLNQKTNLVNQINSKHIKDTMINSTHSKIKTQILSMINDSKIENFEGKKNISQCIPPKINYKKKLYDSINNNKNNSGSFNETNKLKFTSIQKDYDLNYQINLTTENNDFSSNPTNHKTSQSIQFNRQIKNNSYLIIQNHVSKFLKSEKNYTLLINCFYKVFEILNLDNLIMKETFEEFDKYYQSYITNEQKILQSKNLKENELNEEIKKLKEKIESNKKKFEDFKKISDQENSLLIQKNDLLKSEIKQLKENILNNKCVSLNQVININKKNINNVLKNEINNNNISLDSSIIFPEKQIKKTNNPQIKFVPKLNFKNLPKYESSKNTESIQVDEMDSNIEGIYYLNIDYSGELDDTSKLFNKKDWRKSLSDRKLNKRKRKGLDNLSHSSDGLKLF